MNQFGALQTDQQRRAALARANEVRRSHAQLKRDLASGVRRIEDVICDPPALARNARVLQLLLAVPGVGPARARRALMESRIAATKRLGGLTDRQRAELITRITHWAKSNRRQ